MFQKFQSDQPSCTSLRDDEVIKSSDIVEDLVSGRREVVGQSPFYGFLQGQRASQARYMPEVYDVVRRA